MIGLLVAPLPATAKVKTPAPCGGPAAADEWPTFGGDLMNSRHQDLAGAISPATAPLLEPAWSFSTGGAATGTADLNGTPIVAGRCVFLNTAGGDVLALDSATGAQRWRRTIALDPGHAAGLGGIFVSSPAVSSDLVIGLVNQLDAPYAVAVSRTSGALRWRSAPLRAGPGYYTNATPVIVDGLVLAGYSPAEGDPDGRGGIALIDARSGAFVKDVPVIPDADFVAAGHAGAGVWTAPAIDTANGYAYVGTGNPFSKKVEHPYTNAIVKVDIRRKRATFGTVVGALKGNIDQYDPVFRQLVDPACEAVGEDENLQVIAGNSGPCLQLDLDFGAPPNLFTDGSGRLLIGDLQKSGVYHVADAASMTRAWSATMGASCAACNAAATAWDGDGAIYGVGTPGGVMVSLDDAGAYRWASPIADGAHYQSTTSAGGVVFTIDGNGFLDGFDATTGAPLVRRPVAADLSDPTQVPAALSSSGIAVASGMVFVAAGNAVVAYRPPPS